MRLTLKQFEALHAKPKRSKYRNKRVVVHGLKFDSQREADRYFALHDRQGRGEINKLERQVAFVLAPSVRLEGEKRAKPALRYIADFVYEERGQRVVEDFKSRITERESAFRIKRHLLKAVHGIDIRIVK